MQDPSEAAALRTLARCVGDVDAFARERWGRGHLLHHGGDGFDDLLTFADVDHLLSSTSLRLPLFRLVKDGSTVPTGRYTKRGRTGSTTMTGLADPRRVFEQFAGGATIVLQGMHRYWPPVALLCRQLEIALGHPTQTNAYITPAGARGLAVHEDSHDVFVLQAFGRKHWDVYPRRAPHAAADRQAAPILSVELRPGHCLYLPRGTPHGASAQEATSGHLTVGILATTWAEAVGDAWNTVRTHPTFQEPLPVGFHRDPDAFAGMLGARTSEAARWMEKAGPNELAGGRIDRFWTTRPPMLRGVLRDAERIAGLTDGSVVRRRAGSICVLRPAHGHLRVLLGDRELRMPEWLEPAMRRVQRAERFRVADLTEAIGDGESRLVLVRRLTREGMLEVAE